MTLSSDLFVQYFPRAVLKHANIYVVLRLGDSYALAEELERRWGVSSAPDTTESGHSRIVPAVHMALQSYCHSRYRPHLYFMSTSLTS